VVLTSFAIWAYLTAVANGGRPNLVEMAAAQGVHEISSDSSQIFLYAFTRHGQFRKALVLTAGKTFRTGIIKPGAARCVSLLAAMPFDLGDGAGLRVILTDEARRIEAVRIYLDPAHVRADRAWIPVRFDIPPDMDHFILQFDVDAGPRGDTTADWFGLAAGNDAGCLLGE
jgi:hypothetical protein